LTIASSRIPSNSGTERLANARAAEARGEIVQRGRVARLVRGHAIDSGDSAMLMSMLGLDIVAATTTDGRTTRS
jgi:hypothetical protein